MKVICWARRLLLIGTLLMLLAAMSCSEAGDGNQNATRSAPPQSASNTNKQTQNSNAAPKPAGANLQVNSTPTGAAVVLIPIDEAGAGQPEPRGSTPILITGVAPGKYTIDIEKSGYKYFQKDVQLKDGQTVKVEAPLKKG